MSGPAARMLAGGGRQDWKGFIARGGPRFQRGGDRADNPPRRTCRPYSGLARESMLRVSVK